MMEIAIIRTPEVVDNARQVQDSVDEKLFLANVMSLLGRPVENPV